MWNKLTASIKSLSEKGALYILVGNFATKFVTFFGSVFLSRLVSKTDLGVLSYMENLYSYAFVLVGLGLSNAVLRFVVLSRDEKNKMAYVKYVANKSLIIDVIIVIAVEIINIFYPHGESYAAARALLPIFILALPFQDRINQSQMNERAMFANKRYAIIAVGSSALVVIARVLGAYIGGLNTIVWGILIANVILGIALPISTKNTHYKGVDAGRLTDEQKKEASTYSFQYMITNGLWHFFMLMDMFLLGRLIDDATVVADYKIAYTWPVNMAIISSAIGVFIVPYFVKHEDDKPWIKNNYKKTFFASLAIFSSMGIVMFAIAKPLIWVFGEQYYNVIPLMRVLIIGCIIDNVFRYPIANILAAIGKVKYNMIVAAIGFILRTVLNIIFIPRFQGYAVAYNAIISQIVMAVILFICFNKMYGIVGRKE